MRNNGWFISGFSLNCIKTFQVLAFFLTSLEPSFQLTFSLLGQVCQLGCITKHTDLFCWSDSTQNKAVGIAMKKSRVHSAPFPDKPKAQWLHTWKISFTMLQNRTCHSSIQMTRLLNKPHQVAKNDFFSFLTILPGESAKPFRSIKMTFSWGKECTLIYFRCKLSDLVSWLASFFEYLTLHLHLGKKWSDMARDSLLFYHCVRMFHFFPLINSYHFQFSITCSYYILELFDYPQ